MDVRIGRESQPIIIVPARQMGLNFRFGPSTKRVTQTFLGACDTTGPLFGRRAPGQNLECPVIKVPQQARFPRIPHVRANRANIGNRQHQQQSKSFRRLNRIGKIADCFWVLKIPFEGRVCHPQMVEHQPGYGLRLPFIEPHPRA